MTGLAKEQKAQRSINRLKNAFAHVINDSLNQKCGKSFLSFDLQLRFHQFDKAEQLFGKYKAVTQVHFLRDFGFGLTVRGIKKGESVTISNRSKGILGTSCCNS